MSAQTSLFASFLPSEWSEEVYAKGPPFVIENESGRVYLVPRDSDADVRLSGMSSSLGLKKIEGRPGYLVSHANAVKAIREFEWFLRRSWRRRDLLVLWALVYLGERSKWTQSDLSLQVVAEIAGLDVKACEDSLKSLFHAGVGNEAAREIRECATDRRLVELTLEKRVSELPTWTEEVVMEALCSSLGRSVAEIYESVLAQGVGVGAVYKVVERLKKQGYVYPLKHIRVNERGPMREMLSADCQNCFYGFTNPDVCLQDTIRQLEGILGRDYNKTPTPEESSAMYASMKATPYGSRTNRRVLASLRLMREIDGVMNEGHVSSLLKNIEENYRVEFPIKTPAELS